jgi:hypothetical protein
VQVSLLRATCIALGICPGLGYMVILFLVFEKPPY